MSKHSRPAKTSKAETILVVEPDVLTRMVISDYLRECGHLVVEAVSGEEAIEILSTGGIKIDTVFAEVKLRGEMDGFALAHWMRSHASSVEIILTSSISMAAHKASDKCEDGLLAKPYHPQQVVQRLQLLKEKRRSQSE